MGGLKEDSDSSKRVGGKMTDDSVVGVGDRVTQEGRKG